MSGSRLIPRVWGGAPGSAKRFSHPAAGGVRRRVPHRAGRPTEVAPFEALVIRARGSGLQPPRWDEVAPNRAMDRVAYFMVAKSILLLSAEADPLDQAESMHADVGTMAGLAHEVTAN